MAKLKPCPNCGSKKLTMWITCYPRRPRNKHVECDVCHYCCGKNTMFEFTAEFLWNRLRAGEGKMTDKETVKGLGLCSSDYLGCEDGCPYLSMDIGDNSCRNNLIRDALNLILSRNKELLQKDAEIDILICKNERLKDEVSELMEENERLKKRIKAISDQIYSSTLN